MANLQDLDINDASSKRLRNRLSQQAFRKRRSAYVKDLERQLEIRGNSENEQIQKLEDDNRLLRQQLTLAVGKLENIQMNLRSLSEAMTNATHQNNDSSASGCNLEEEPSNNDQEPSSDMNGKDYQSLAQDTSSPKSTSLQSDEPSRYHQDLFDSLADDMEQVISTSRCDTGSTGVRGRPRSGASLTLPVASEGRPLVAAASPSHLSTTSPASTLGRNITTLLDAYTDLRSLPSVWSHQHQMGPAAFQARCSNPPKAHETLVKTNSYFSDHMHLIRQCLSTVWRSRDSMEMSITRMRLSATFMLSMFHTLSRPLALSWYTATNFSENVANLTMWQMDHSREMYSQLHPNYRPSALQMVEEYPSIIDWCPFPTVRDKLILMHSANPYLDNIICDIATAYVVEVNGGDLTSDQTNSGFIRVWDLICASGDSENIQSVDQVNITPTTCQEESLSAHNLPAPNTALLFTPQYARQAFKFLSLDDGIPRFKLDPQLFVQYPELYDPHADVIAMGTPIAPTVQTTIPYPSSPGPDTMRIYQHLANWCVTSICKA